MLLVKHQSAAPTSKHLVAGSPAPAWRTDRFAMAGVLRSIPPCVAVTEQADAPM